LGDTSCSTKHNKIGDGRDYKANDNIDNACVASSIEKCGTSLVGWSSCNKIKDFADKIKINHAS
jgi:hypothetical protein